VSISIARRTRKHVASCIRLAGARDRARKPVLFGVKYISILNQRAIAKPWCKIARTINILFFERSCVKRATEIEVGTLRKRNCYNEKQKEISNYSVEKTHGIFSSFRFYFVTTYEKIVMLINSRLMKNTAHVLFQNRSALFFSLQSFSKRNWKS